MVRQFVIMEQDTYAQIKTSVRKILDINLDYYKDEQMRRRLDSWLVRSGAPDWAEYFHRIRSDERELGRFRDYLTINVSSFFRDIERWQALKDHILPDLLKSALHLRPGDGGLRIWSAGCSIGAEPYTLAMILDDVSPTRRHRILATDLDRGALNKSKAGGPYTADEIQNLSSAQCAAYLQAGGPPFYIKPTLGKKIEFREHNLIEHPTETGFDLIVCRNVVIYFTTDTKDLLYRKFYQALRPGGILFVGATEIIPRPVEIGFRSNGISFYKRPES
jgi:chemotaxis protein methyltransferase CheR